MKDSDFQTVIGEIALNAEAVGFVLGRMLARKPGSIAEAIDVLSEIDQGLPNVGEGLVSGETISALTTCLKLGLSQAQTLD